MIFRICILAILGSGICPKLWSQYHIISGKTIEEESGTPIPFVNIGIVGTAYGTCANEQGAFKLRIPSTQKSAQIKVSAIGYATVYVKASALLQQPPAERTIVLKQQPYYLPQVNIIPPEQILKKAFSNFAHYNQHDFRLSLFYRGVECTAASDTAYAAEAILEKDYQHGYKQTRIGTYILQKRNLRSEDFADAIDEKVYQQGLAEYDPVAFMCNLEEAACMQGLSIRLEGYAYYDRQAVVILHLEIKHPTQKNTHAFLAGKIKRYSEKLYILEKNHVIIRRIIQVSYQTPNVKKMKMGQVISAPRYLDTYTYIRNFKAYQGKYYLSYQLVKVTNLIRLLGGDVEKLTSEHEMITTHIQTEVSDMFHKHNRIPAWNINGIPYDPKFWATYTFP